jgi:hypothetical protein
MKTTAGELPWVWQTWSVTPPTLTGNPCIKSGCVEKGDRSWGELTGVSGRRESTDLPEKEWKTDAVIYCF